MDPFEDLDHRLRETRERVRWFDHLAAQRTTLGRQDLGDLGGLAGFVSG
ncbi:hypothetical protein OUY22_19630 [Nonomuraea sp. MCN248]|uniref:Uncharacterized protein n=1 Tax=Nonomuraea corallina TaxID=2989783 RepID=A0ABT4SFD0_9ACTN|nr:hypothetical protein [Nonomuraea corallina]MDA0635636.1 hypothetical protein [Nonomuraea corallina]